MVPARTAALAATVASLWMAGAAVAAEAAVRIVATTPDLADIAAAVGGDAVEVTALLEGPQDPHFAPTRPRFVRSLLGADLLVVNGLGLESGWLPGLLRGARNPAFGPGGTRRFDASAAITPLRAPETSGEPGQVDLHADGDPHYLADPVNGLRVAALLARRLKELWPERAASFVTGEDAFRRAAVTALVGEALVERHGPEVLAARLETENLLDLVGDDDALGGWLAALAPHAGTRAAQDHDLWRYFARRFRIELVATLQPRPGATPSSDDLAEIVNVMRAENVPIFLSCPYVDVRNARGIARRSGSRVVLMAHQADSRRGAAGYLGSVDFNVRSIASAL